MMYHAAQVTGLPKAAVLVVTLVRWVLPVGLDLQNAQVSSSGKGDCGQRRRLVLLDGTLSILLHSRKYNWNRNNRKFHHSSVVVASDQRSSY